MKQKKVEMENQKKEKVQLLERNKEAFIKCKDRCTCMKPGGKCFSLGLRQCSICKNVLNSQCGKLGCKINGLKPKMIDAAAKSKRDIFDITNLDYLTSEESDDAERISTWRI